MQWLDAMEGYATVNDWAPAVRLLTRFRAESRGVSGAVVEPWLPVVGAAMGLVAWVLIALCVWLGGARAGTVLAALVVFGFEGWLTAGRRYGAAIRLLESLPDGNAGTEASAYIRLAAFQALLVMKLVSYGVLAATGHGAWLIVTGALSTAAAAHVLGGIRSRPTSDAMEIWRDWGHWLVAAALAVVAGRLSGDGETLPALFSLLVAWLLPAVLGPLLGPEAREPGSTGWLSLAEALSLVVLGIGVLAALAG